MKKKTKTGHTRKLVLWTLFAVYFAVMLFLLFLQRAGTASELSYSEYYYSSTNFVPFKTLKSYYAVFIRNYGSSAGIVRVAFRNLVGNVVLFIPIGIFLPCCWKTQRNFLVFLITSFLTIAFVEGMQFATKLGSCDIDDLILNMTGAFLGYIIWLIPPVKKIFSLKR